MRITLTVTMSLLLSLPVLAQCRLTRTQNTDSTQTGAYFYDQQGRLSSIKQNSIYQGKKLQSETYFAYNEQGKIVETHHLRNDTLFGTRQFLYQKDRLVQLVDVYLVDSTVLIGSFSYNNKGQLNQLYRKSNKGDTVLTTYEWADEGWLKRYEDRSNYKPIENIAVETEWDANMTLKDPERMFFEGQFLEFQTFALLAHIPLSVQGNFKSQKYFTPNKNGQLELMGKDELFDFKANASGYLLENKYKIDDDVQTFRYYYEGCKD